MNNLDHPSNQVLQTPVSQAQSVDIYAHRGSTILAPENTIKAFNLALSYGADVLEIDVRLSRDNHVVVVHDARVDRTCNGHGAIAEMTLTELKQLDAAWHFRGIEGETYRGQGVNLCTLSELLEYFPSQRINIDIKDNSIAAAKAVADCIHQADAQHRVNVGSFHQYALGHFRQAAPDVTTAATQTEVAALYFGRTLIKKVPYQYLQIPVRHLGLPLATKNFVSCAQRLNLSAVYWTINTTPQMQMLISRGVNGLVTDRVDLASKLLRPKQKPK